MGPEFSEARNCKMYVCYLIVPLIVYEFKMCSICTVK